MHYNLTADDYDVEIGELVDQYRAKDDRTGFGLVSVDRHAYSGDWEATVFVDGRFAGEHVQITRNGTRYITATGSDLCEALRNVRNRFVSAAPVEFAKGA